MTKQHLEFLAALINAAHNGTSAETLATMAAAYCADTNPRFDKARFLAACGTHPDDNNRRPDGKVARMYGLENHAS